MNELDFERTLLSVSDTLSSLADNFCAVGNPVVGEELRLQARHVLVATRQAKAEILKAKCEENL